MAPRDTRLLRCTARRGARSESPPSQMHAANVKCHPSLQVRTLPLSKHRDARNVGWDMPCETLNRDIKDDVTDRSMESIRTYCESRDFVATVANGVDAMVQEEHSALQDALHKNIDHDVRKLKAFLCKLVGETWSKATRTNAKPSFHSVKARAKVPWKMMKQTMYAKGKDHFTKWVESHVKNLAPWHKWAA